MPASLTYPGVYIEEIPSGVRTITGVATSITAFIGRAVSGPTDDPVLINSFADYERRFGGLAVESPMSYAVRDFYLNGGSQALIIRVTPSSDATTAATAATIRLEGDGSPSDDLVLEAASEGEWGNRLRAAVDHDSDKALATSLSPQVDETLFNLFIEYKVRPDREEIARERFLNVSTEETHPRYLPRVLENESSFVRVRDPMPATRPRTSVVTLSPSKPQVHWTDADADSGSDGGDLADGDIKGEEDPKTGLYALNKADIFNLLCIPPKKRGEATNPDVYQTALKICVDRRAMLIVDPDPDWAVPLETAVSKAIEGRDDLGLSGNAARNAALYFPCVRQIDPLRDNQIDTFVPCGIVAGIMARTDTARGVWKAPAGLEAALNGVQGLQLNLNDLENGRLNQLGINCLRSFPVTGRIVWGARTIRGADQAADEYKYVPVRRLALFIEESLYRGTQWVVFEPNDEPLWGQIRLAVGAFMQNLFRQGAFQGRSPREAYLVKCDAETTTQNDINLGVVNILVGFAPLKPAEFVVIKIQQLAGQVQA
jgi:phage tail sheath protein FI